MQASDVPGAQLYSDHCASCHGADARGHGPAASALKVPPPDLTALARKNKGRFPAGNIFQVIKWGGSIASHGSRDMPVWGTALKSSNHEDQAAADAKINLIIKYLEGVQVK